MNRWTRQSIRLANSPGYLDDLGEVYVMQVNPERPLPAELKHRIRDAYENRNTQALIRALLESEIFPVKDSYIGFIRKKPKAIEENPQTIERIGSRLYALGWEGLMREATRPKETNRQLGASFRSWLPSLGYPVLPREEFIRSNGGVALLEGADKALKDFAREELNLRLDKGIDIIFKKGRRYVLGEAKFLTTPGGEQDRGFEDAANFISGNTPARIHRIAIIDGYVWIEANSGLHQRILDSGLDMFSVLLLKDYIEAF